MTPSDWARVLARLTEPEPDQESIDDALMMLSDEDWVGEDGRGLLLVSRGRRPVKPCRPPYPDRPWYWIDASAWGDETPYGLECRKTHPWAVPARLDPSLFRRLKNVHVPNASSPAYCVSAENAWEELLLACV